MPRALSNLPWASALVLALGLAQAGCREEPPADDDVADDDAADDDAADDDVADDDAADDDATGDDYRHVLTVTEALVGDFSCISSPQEPSAIPEDNKVTAELQAHVLDFEEDSGVAGAYASVWGNNDPGSTPGFVSDDATGSDGLVTVPSGVVTSCVPYAYETHTNFSPPETQQTYELGVILPPTGGAPFSGGDADFTSVSFATYNIIPLVLSIQPTPGKGIAAGTFEDCNGERVQNAQILVKDASGNLAQDVYVRFFVDDLPDRDQAWTSEDGLFGAIDVSVGDWTIELWGVPNASFTCPGDLDDGGRCRVTTVPITVTADSVNIANARMKPYPDACFEE
ncbi:hypothetical protein L6R50_27620 [Myxococcota bacterium]|nr:hypothetical protein [Myxococcota bacterium]